ncbi:LuxR C-terminal-related transcriptional regulator [Microbacterium sp.]|uniref:helix-turn-helix transcriptional regulator n=1 Tax=Microbacterium sp. TaxID=51671 RepID=UPI0033407762
MTMSVLGEAMTSPGERVRRTSTERMHQAATAMVESALPGGVDLRAEVRERLRLSRAEAHDLLAAAKLMAMVRSGEAISESMATSVRRTPASTMPLAFAAAAAEAMLSVGDTAHASRCAHRAHELAVSAGDAPWLYRSLGLLAASHAANGQFADAEAVLVHGRAIHSSEGWPEEFCDPFALLARAVEAIRRQDAERLGRLILATVEASTRRPVLRVLVEVLDASRSWASGDDSRALAIASRIGQGLGVAAPLPFVRDFALRLQATILLQRGEPLRARGLLRDERPDAHHLSCPAVIRAATQLHIGDPSQALFETQDCMRRRVDHNLLTFPMVLLVRAAAQLRLGQSEAATRLIRDAVAFGASAQDAPLPGLTALPSSDAQRLLDIIVEHALAPEHLLPRVRGHLQAFVPAAASRPVPPPIEMLSRRERDVADALASPLDFAQIAEHLHLSMNTVKTHTRAIYRKLSVSSRHDAVIRLTTVGYYER